MAAAISTGLPKLRIEEAAARTQARIDSGQQTVVGVNRYRVDDAAEGWAAAVEVRRIDNAEVRRLQLRRLAELRAGRDEARLRAALDALTAAARSGDGNLLGLSIDAARAQATVGEISDALETVYGRHVAEITAVEGVYRKAASSEGDGSAAAAAIDRVRERVGRVRRVAGASAAHPGREGRPGRPRPRPESDRHRVPPTWASTLMWGRCSRRLRRWPARLSKQTCMWWACRLWRRAISSLVPELRSELAALGRSRHCGGGRRGGARRRRRRVACRGRGGCVPARYAGRGCCRRAARASVAVAC